MKYTKLSKKSYDKRYNLDNPRKIHKYSRLFKEGTEVLYYVGDQYTKHKKWRTKWTGPLHVHKALTNSTVIIVDKETGNQKRVSIDRLKVYKKMDYIKYSDLMDNTWTYDQYQQRLKLLLYKHSVITHPAEVNLDFRKRIKRQQRQKIVRRIRGQIRRRERRNRKH